MLEILAIIFLAKKNAANAAARGRKKGGFVALTIALWLGLECVGALVGQLLELGIGSYLLALLLAVGGGFLSYFITKNCSPGDYFPQGEPSAEGTEIRPEGTFTEERIPVPAKHGRAVWSGLLLIGGWLLLLFLQGLPKIFGNFTTHGSYILGGFLLFSPEACYFLTAAVLATAVYLVIQKGWQNKLLAAGFGIVSAFMSACNDYADALYLRTMGAFGIGNVVSFINARIWSTLRSTFLVAAAAVLVAVLFRLLLRGKTEKTVVLATGGIAAGVLLIGELVLLGIQYNRYLLVMGFLRVFTLVLPIIGEALCLYLTVVALRRLCNMQSGAVRLRSLGLAWAWVGAIGCLLGAAWLIWSCASASVTMAYTAQMLLCLVVSTGYILLLCERRAGIYVVVIGAGLLLLGQLFNAVYGLLCGAEQYWTLLLGGILGAVNPLLGWLAVRAADRKRPV